MKQALVAYSNGVFIAAGYGFQYWSFLAGSARVGRAAKRVSEIKECLDHIDAYFPKPPRKTFWEIFKEDLRQPNLPAAVCLANRASVLLKLAGAGPKSTEDEDVGLKYAQRALRDAKDAVELFCPEYEKGHHRVLECYWRLGLTEAAKQQAEDIRAFKELQSMTPCVAFGLLQLGWITHPEFSFIYDDMRMQEILSRIAAATEVRSWYLQVSMVPFVGGQALIFNMNSFPFFGEDIDYRGVAFHICDGEHDNDLELPPHGRISKFALKNALQFIRNFMRRLKMRSIQIASMMLGQGLVEQVERVQRAIAKTHADLFVFPSQQTYASELHQGPDHIVNQFVDAFQNIQN